jgi:hypothetical protein
MLCLGLYNFRLPAQQRVCCRGIVKTLSNLPTVNLFLRTALVLSVILQ